MSFRLKILGLCWLWFLVGTPGHASEEIDKAAIVGQLNQVVAYLSEDRQLDSAGLILANVRFQLKGREDAEQYGPALYNSYLYHFQVNQLDSAIHYGKIAMKWYHEREMRVDYADIAEYLALDFNTLGNYPEATRLNQLALDEFRALGDSVSVVRLLAAQAYVYHDVRDYQQGIEYGQKAQHVARAIPRDSAHAGWEFSLMEALNATAINYDELGEYDQAIALQQEILALRPHVPDTLLFNRSFNNMGNSYLKQGKLDEAQANFQRALDLGLKIGRPYNLATVNTNLGTVAWKQKNWELARAYLAKAEQYARACESSEKMQDVLMQWSEYHRAKGDFDQALIYLKKFHALKDSLFDTEKARIVTELETQYQTHQKELEVRDAQATIDRQDLELQRNGLLIAGLIALVGLLVTLGLFGRARLRKRQEERLHQTELNNERAQVQAVMASQEDERERIASDLHDGFGQMISSLKMNVQALRDADTSLAPSTFDESENVLSGMYDELRKICFDLLPNSLVSGSLGDALRELTDRLNRPGQVRFILYWPNQPLNLTQKRKVAVYRIVQEWINNALKYGNQRELAIQGTLENGRLTMTIDSDGTGFDPTRLTESGGNGWRNITARTRFLGGEVSVDMTDGREGILLLLEFPLREPDQAN